MEGRVLMVKNVNIEKLVPMMNRALRAGKVLQLEYNFQTDKIKVLEAKMKRFDNDSKE
jgi:hypothetical protein